METRLIRHTWFDLNGTLAIENADYRAALDQLTYEAYALATGSSVSDTMIREYNEAYIRYGSKTAVFAALGMSADYWPKYFAQLDELRYLTPNDDVTSALLSLSECMPISLMSNTRRARTEAILAAVQIPVSIFTNVLTGERIPRPKPAPDGFKLIVEISGIPADQILFVGDREKADIEPAKSVGMITAFAWGVSSIADFSLNRMSDLIEIVGCAS
jgi:HAD superfamily hydrolase (TIGR01549 family)